MERYFILSFKVITCPFFWRAAICRRSKIVLTAPFYHSFKERDSVKGAAASFSRSDSTFFAAKIYAFSSGLSGSGTTGVLVGGLQQGSQGTSQESLRVSSYLGGPSSRGLIARSSRSPQTKSRQMVSSVGRVQALGTTAFPWCGILYCEK